MTAARDCCTRPSARAEDPAQKMGFLVLKMESDFCRQVRDNLTCAGCDADCVEVGVNSGVCYNPCTTTSFAVAATVLNNLFGRSKERFWQQAYSDSLKMVISLRRITALENEGSPFRKMFCTSRIRLSPTAAKRLSVALVRTADRFGPASYLRDSREVLCTAVPGIDFRG